MSEAGWYELLASLLYIYKNIESWKIENQPQSIFEKLIECKPQYSKEQCEYAYGVLSRCGFVKVGE